MVVVADGSHKTLGLKLNVIGPFDLRLSDGAGITITSKKARALLALLAVAPGGRRERRWLQYKLWSERGEREGAASLRQTLSALRRALAPMDEVLQADRTTVALSLDQVDVDALNLGGLADRLTGQEEFLEGLDVKDPEFDNWLREQRGFWARQIDAHQGGGAGTVAPVAAPLDVPCVTLMPFASADHPAPQAQELGEQVLDQLARHRWISFMDWTVHTARSAAGAARPATANYAVTGQLRTDGTQLILTAELTHLTTGQSVKRAQFTALAADPADMGADLAAVARELAIDVAGNFSCALAQAYEERSQSRAAQSDAALVWQGRWHINRLTPEDFEKARMIFEDITTRNPGHVEAHIYLALTTLWRVWTCRADPRDIKLARRQAQQAIKLAVSDGRGYWIAGCAECWLGNKSAAVHYTDEAIRLCPSLAFAHDQRGTNLAYDGDPLAAINALERAIRLAPHHPQRFCFEGEYALAALLAGDLSAALQHADHALLLRPAYWYSHMVKVLALHRMGRPDAVARAKRALYEFEPRFNRSYINWLPFSDRSQNARMIDEMF